MQNFIQLTRCLSGKRFFCLLLSLCFHSFTYGENSSPETPEQWYQIEYIIFEHLDTDDHILRYEDTPYPSRNNKQFTHIISGKQPASRFQYSQLYADKMVLSDALQKLNRSRSVHVMDMGAWQQPLSSEQASPPVKIDKLVTKDRVLFGELQIRKSRYTHAEFKVFLSKPITVPYKNITHWFLQKNTHLQALDLVRPLDTTSYSNLTGESVVYQDIRYLGESRRIKESEIHYIDHPVIGAIVTIKEVPSPYQFSDDTAY